MKYKQQRTEKSASDHMSPNPLGLFSRYPKSWWAQTNYSPIDPAEQTLPELDDSPEAAEARERAAKHSLLIPLAAIISVIAVLVIGVLIKMNS